MVLVYGPTMGEWDIKYYVKKEGRNLSHANIDVNSRKLITEFLVDGVKCTSNIQNYCSNMNFSENSRYDGMFKQVTNKGGKFKMKYIKIFKNAQALLFSVGKVIISIT